MAKKDEFYAEIRARRGTGPPWYKAPKGQEIMYFMRYNSKTKEVMISRGPTFVLPIKQAPKNKELEKVTTAPTADGLTGDYVDFLIEDSPIRCQTIRSLLSEVFGIENTGKPTKKKRKKKKKR